jgi:hypothetical protein
MKSSRWRSSMGRINLSCGSLKMRDLLVQQGLHKALKNKTKKPESMTNED